MFVISKKRHSMFVGLTSAWVLLSVYSFFGLIFWIGFIAVGAILPVASSLYSDMHENLGMIVNTIWPASVFVGAVTLLVASWFFSVRSLFSYGDRKRILEQINKVIADIPSLSMVGGSVSHTMKRSYGSSSTEIVAMGGGDFEVRSTYRYTSGATVNEVSIFGASTDFFSSAFGFSEQVMDSILGMLLVEKEYGVQSRHIDEVRQ
jgi:hypothetical protein